MLSVCLFHATKQHTHKIFSSFVSLNVKSGCYSLLVVYTEDVKEQQHSPEEEVKKATTTITTQMHTRNKLVAFVLEIVVRV